MPSCRPDRACADLFQALFDLHLLWPDERDPKMPTEVAIRSDSAKSTASGRTQPSNLCAAFQLFDPNEQENTEYVLDRLAKRLLMDPLLTSSTVHNVTCKHYLWDEKRRLQAICVLFRNDEHL